MNCAGCGRENRAGAKFCGGCGRPLALRCPACGSESQPGSQFCDACGAPLVAPQAPAAEARKVVTIVFADLIGSTALHERLDAESARRLMDRYHRSMGAVVEAHGGTVMQLLGDGVLAGFGVPRVAEDDAIRAVRAAVGMQQAFRELVAEQAGLAGDIGLRVAVNTGEVVAGDDHTHVMGDPVNVAARLQQEARDGDVLLGESTQRLVAREGDAGALRQLRAQGPRRAGGGVPRGVARASRGRAGDRVRRARGRAAPDPGGLRHRRRDARRPARRDPRIAGSRQVAADRRVHPPPRAAGRPC